MKLPERVRSWTSDRDYIDSQRKDSSWNHRSAFGEFSAQKFIKYGEVLRKEGLLYHDDKVADFGGNDGFCSNAFYLIHKIKPLVIDCEPDRLLYATEVYKLKTLQCFIEEIPLPDKYVDWGFCSHTLEHTRDPVKALREMSRLVKRGMLLVVPLEGKEHARCNTAHSLSSPTMLQWKQLIGDSGVWAIKKSKRICGTEAIFWMLPV